MHYYDIQKHWRKLKPIYHMPEMLYFSWLEMEEYKQDRAEEYNFKFVPRPFNLEHRPKKYDGLCWRHADIGCGKPGRKPAYWDFVCAGACHFVNNVGLMVASVAMPERPWRLVINPDGEKTHTTVWDGDETLFDINFLALDVGADEAWNMAAEQPESFEMPPGNCVYHGHGGEDALMDQLQKKGLLPQIKMHPVTT